MIYCKGILNLLFSYYILYFWGFGLYLIYVIRFLICCLFDVLKFVKLVDFKVKDYVVNKFGIWKNG